MLSPDNKGNIPLNRNLDWKRRNSRMVMPGDIAYFFEQLHEMGCKIANQINDRELWI